MPKPSADQFNLFGGLGVATEEQIAVATGVELAMHYLKCGICGGCSQPIMLPRTLLANPGRAMAQAMRDAGWTHECPDCERAGKCSDCVPQ